MAGSLSQIQICSRTWNHESLNLFDFEAPEDSVKSETFRMSSAGACFRHGDQLEYVDVGSPVSSKAKPVFRCQPGPDHVDIVPAKLTSSSSRLYVVVKDLQEGHAQLAQGDEVLLGRALVEVKQLVADAESAEQPEVWDSNSTCCREVPPTERLQCRICLTEGASAEDPLLRPCACSGSVAAVHLECLRRWTLTRLELPEGEVDFYTYRRPTCEMCKADYPNFVSRHGKKEPLVRHLPTVKPPFVVLHSKVKQSKNKSKEHKLSHHVVSLSKGGLAKIGRGSECNVRLEEVSMSRWHSTIRLIGDRFVVEDQGSKFGTLLAIRGPWPVARGRSVSVKVGRTLFSFALPSGEPSCSRSRGLSSAQSNSSRDDEESVGKQQKSHSMTGLWSRYQSL